MKPLEPFAPQTGAGVESSWAKSNDFFHADIQTKLNLPCTQIPGYSFGLFLKSFGITHLRDRKYVL